MQKITWDDSHSIGVDEIDRQHADFVRIINRLQIMYEKGAPRELTLAILIELYKYADYHFTSEENFMTIIKYPLLENQKQSHREILKALQEKLRELGTKGVIFESLVEFLTAWFLSHTKNEDIKIGEFVKKMPAQERASVGTAGLVEKVPTGVPAAPAA